MTVARVVEILITCQDPRSPVKPVNLEVARRNNGREVTVIMRRKTMRKN